MMTDPTCWLHCSLCSVIEAVSATSQSSTGNLVLPTGTHPSIPMNSWGVRILRVYTAVACLELVSSARTASLLSILAVAESSTGADVGLLIGG
ncbi:hypothetical protein F5Y03DRAFT_248672 [Xylaria venustula]|nr:hypothetical protein F5Y03DRAFT_248672 [Xylaria venustula]